MRGEAYGFGADAFVTKFNTDGTGLLFSTYLGGSGDDYAGGIVVNTSGQCYVAGRTASTDFPKQGAYQDTYGGGSSDVFVTRFNAAGDGLVYSTYLGGSSMDYAWGIAANDYSNAYVVGWTSSTDFPTENPNQDTLRGVSDAFVAKLARGDPRLFNLLRG